MDYDIQLINKTCRLLQEKKITIAVTESVTNSMNLFFSA